MSRRYRKISRSAKPPTRRPLAGLERHECPTHGFLADALPHSSSLCPCGRQGKVTIPLSRSTT